MRVLIVDRQDASAGAYRRLLQNRAGITITGCVTTLEEALTLAAGADVLLVNAATDDREQILRLVRVVTTYYAHAHVLVTGLADGSPDLFPFIDAGAAGYVTVGASPAEFVSNVRAAVRGEAVVSPRVAAIAMRGVGRSGGEEDGDASGLESLSWVEQNVLHLLGRQLSLEEVAVCMGIQRDTADGHLHRIKQKLNVNTTQEAVAALKLRLQGRSASE